MNLRKEVTADLVGPGAWEIDFSHKRPISIYVDYNREKSTLSITNYGSLILPGYAYQEAKECLKSHMDEGASIHLHLSINSVNASGVRELLNLFIMLNHAWKAGKEVSVCWITTRGEDKTFELAHDFSELFDFDMNVIAY